MNTLRKITGIVTDILLIPILILAILLVGVRVIGLKPYTVISGSMEPAYHVGSLIYVKNVSVTELKEKDPVTFYLNGTTVATHRIIEIMPDPADPDARYFRTQGDANDTPDEPFHSSKVIGKPVFTIPYLGYLSNYLQHQPGKSIALATCAALILAAFLPGLWSNKSDKAETDGTAEEQTSDNNSEG